MTSPPAGHLSAEDARILDLEKRNIRGHTCKIVVVDGRIPVEELQASVGQRLDRAPSLRWRLDAGPPHRRTTPTWVEDPEFDVTRHVRAFPDGAPAGAGELERVVGLLMARPLERDRPLWQMDVVDVDAATTAIVWRIHHSLADGIASIHLAETVIFDDDRDGKDPLSAGVTPAPSSGDLGLATAIGRHQTPVTAGAATTAEPAAAEAARAGAVHPPHQLARIFPVLQRELKGGAVGTPLARHVGPRREVAFAGASLASLVDVAHRAGQGVTLNDLVLSVVGGALRSWMSRLESPAAGLRAKVPVSLHDHDLSPATMANHDAFMFVDLDVEEADPLRRLLTISHQTRQRKNSHDAEALDALFRDLGHVSRFLQDLAVRWSTSPRVFAVNVSNVPGPRRPLTVLGAPVSALYTLAEVAERHALRVAVMSGAGRLTFGLCADPDAVAGVDLLAEGIDTEIGAVTAAVAHRPPVP